MATGSRWKVLISWVWLLLAPTAARGMTPSPAATFLTPPASPTAAVATATVTPPRPTATPTVPPAPSPNASAAVDTMQEAPAADPVAAATAVAPRARAFRTPERPAPPVFVAPGADAPAADTPDDVVPAPAAPAMRAPGARGGSAVVVFRATARTAIEGFDVRVAYPRTLGTFASDGQQADCNAGTGTLVVGSDRGTGELRLLVAGAQGLPLPLDVFCRFTLIGGGGLGPGQFAVRVAEVTSDAKRADPSLLIVTVSVR